MKQRQMAHMGKIGSDFWELMSKKYVAGQKEHGGNLWDKSAIGLVDAALDEAVDQVVYLITLRDKLKALADDAHEVDRIEAEMELDAALRPELDSVALALRARQKIAAEREKRFA